MPMNLHKMVGLYECLIVLLGLLTDFEQQDVALVCNFLGGEVSISNISSMRLIPAVIKALEKIFK